MQTIYKTMASPKVFVCLLSVSLLLINLTLQVKIEASSNPDIEKIKFFIDRRSTKPPPDIEGQWEAYLQNRLHNFTATEKRCLILRRHLSTLPATETNKAMVSFFQNLFKKRENTNYRKAAYEMIMRTKDHDDIPEIRYMKGIVPQLYRLKLNYHRNYPQSNLLKTDDVDKQNLRNDLENIKEMMAEAQEKMSEINMKKSTCMNELEKITKALKDPSSEIFQNMRTVQYWEKLQTHIYNVSYIADITETTTFEVYKEIIPENEASLKNFYDLLKRFDQFDKIELFLNYTKNRINQVPGSKIKIIANKIDNFIAGLDSIQVDMEEDLENLRDVIFKAMQKKITNVFFKIRADPKLIRYQELLSERVDYEDELTSLASDLISYEETIMQIDLKLGTLDAEIYKTFIVSKKDISDMEMKIIEQEETEAWLNNLENEKCSIDFPGEKEMVEKGRSILYKFRNFSKILRNVQKKEMRFLKQIYELEIEIDKTIGLMFASVYVLKNGLRCFTNSELSYYFFNMFKVNMLVHEIIFIKSFLSAIKPSHARKFMVLNYAIFTNEAYVDKIIRSNRPHLVSGLSRKGISLMIDQFAINNSLMVNLYKNYINAENQNHQENVIDGSIGSIVYYILYFLHQSYKEEMGDGVSVSMILNILTATIWGMVPFIDHMMFLQTMVNKFLVLLFGFIRMLISKFLKIGKEKMNMVMKKLGKNIMTSDYSAYTYDLDFEKVIEEQKQKIPEPTMTISFRQIEDLYLEYFEDNSVLIKAEKINVFNPQEFLLNENDVIELEQVETNEEMDPSDVQEDDIFD